jgi:hypothetical protein
MSDSACPFPVLFADPTVRIARWTASKEHDWAHHPPHLVHQAIAETRGATAAFLVPPQPTRFGFPLEFGAARRGNLLRRWQGGARPSGERWAVPPTSAVPWIAPEHHQRCGYTRGLQTFSVFPRPPTRWATARHDNTECAMLSPFEGRKQRTCRSAAGGSEKDREAPLLCQVVHALLEHVFHLAVDLLDVLLVVDAFGVVVELDRLQESGANLGR